MKTKSKNKFKLNWNLISSIMTTITSLLAIWVFVSEKLIVSKTINWIFISFTILISVALGGLVYMIYWRCRVTVKDQFEIEFKKRYDQLLEDKKSVEYSLESCCKTFNDIGKRNNILFLAITKERCKTPEGAKKLAEILYPELKNSIQDENYLQNTDLPKELIIELNVIYREEKLREAKNNQNEHN